MKRLLTFLKSRICLSKKRPIDSEVCISLLSCTPGATSETLSQPLAPCPGREVELSGTDAKDRCEEEASALYDSTSLWGSGHIHQAKAEIHDPVDDRVPPAKEPEDFLGICSGYSFPNLHVALLTSL